MEYTTNYHLPQWVETDRIQMKDFNDAMASIENGLDSANQTAAAVQAQVETGLGELSSNVNAILKDVGSGSKNCRIAYGSYSGKGTYGAGSPNSLTFGFCPAMLYVIDLEEAKSGNNGKCFLKGCVSITTSMSSTTTLNWSDTGMSWYNNGNAGYQYNTSGHTYYYCAIGYSNN